MGLASSRPSGRAATTTAVSTTSLVRSSATSSRFTSTSISTTTSTLRPVTTSTTVTTTSATPQPTGPTCPTTEIRVYSRQGQIYAVCDNSDYVGPSTQVIANIQDSSACAQQCAQTTGCQQAVFDKVANVCHIKGASKDLTFGSNNRFATLRYVGDLRNGDAISTCPSATLYYATDGSNWEICAKSDWRGNSLAISPDVASNADCTQKCADATGCVRAVFQPSTKICHLKDGEKNARFVDDTFESMRLLQRQVTRNNKALGRWSAPIRMPVVPAAAFVVPEQPYSYRILGFSSWGAFQFGGASGRTQFADYNWHTGAVSQREVQNTGHDMFCPGISSTVDGQVIVTGGSNAEIVSSYDYRKNSWTRLADMKIARGYQSSTILSDGRIFTIGGSYSGGIGGREAPVKNGEVYDTKTGAWTLLPGTDVTKMLTTDHEGPWRTDNHAWLHAWKNGAVFQAGPSKAMNWFGTNGTGSTLFAGIRDSQNDAMCGVHVMYDAVAGKIWAAGGSQDYTDSVAFDRSQLITISEPGRAATVENLAPMGFRRGFANVVVLPNGQIIVTGGQARSLVFTDIDSVYEAELWDPTTKQYTKLAAAHLPRNYHSVSLLLADGSVLVGGGGLCYNPNGAECDQTVNHFDYERLSPPYLFNDDGSLAKRPTVRALVSDSDQTGNKVKVGGTLTVSLDDVNGSTFSLVRLGSVTHSTNTDQRRVPISQATQNSSSYTLRLPSDSGILLPGYYYLFAMSSTGTPSIARTVQVTL